MNTITQKISKTQNSRIHGLLPKEFKNDKEAKGDFVQQFTNDPEKRSTTMLTYDQANEMIERLGGTFIPQTNKPYLKFDWKNPKHRKILSLCREYGWEKKLNGRLVADLNALYTWLTSEKSPVKKPLINMTTIELPKIITALENMVLHKFQQSITKKGKDKTY